MVEIVKYEKAKFEKNKLTIDDSMTVQEWKDLGQSLKQVEGSVQFWIGDWARFGEKKGFTGKYLDSKVYDELEEITGIDRRTIQDYKTVAERTSAGRHADLDFSHHREVAMLPEEKQLEFLTKARDEKLSVRELRQEIRKDGKIYESKELPDDVFNVIYADPPWEYSNSGFEMSAASHYPTMDIEKLCSLQVATLSAENSICFLWVTNPILKDGLRLLEDWGFEYKTNFAWVKENHTAGFYVFGKHELLLIGVKGSMLPIGEKFHSVINANNDVHSKKPSMVYDMIEKMYPECKYLELFARETRDGWQSWGNEV